MKKKVLFLFPIFDFKKGKLVDVYNYLGKDNNIELSVLESDNKNKQLINENINLYSLLDLYRNKDYYTSNLGLENRLSYKKGFYHFINSRHLNDYSGLVFSNKKDTNDLFLLKKVYHKLYYIYFNLINKIKPDIVLSGHQDCHLTIAWLILEEMGIKKYMNTPDYFFPGYRIFDNIYYGSSILEKYSEQIIKKGDSQILNNFINKNPIKDNSNILPKGYKYINIFKNYLYIYQIMKGYSKEEKILFMHGYTISSIIMRFLNRILYFKILYNLQKSPEQIIKLKDSGLKILFFPLHFQPEAATLSTQPLFNDQLYLIRLISQALPSNWILLVKDHPQQDIYYREKFFYSEIKKFPNVFYINNQINIKDELGGIIDKSISLAGTQGFLDMINGKPPLVFSDIYYSVFKYIRKANINNFYNFQEQLIEFLDDNIDYSKDKGYQNELIKFLKTYKTSVIITKDRKEAYMKIIKDIN